MGGVMEASCRGAHEAGGLVAAISWGDDKTALNRYVDIPIMTGMKSGRNYLNILSSDVVIAISVNSSGTLSEVAFALQLKKPLIIVGGRKSMRGYISKINGGDVYFVNNIKKIEQLISQGSIFKNSRTKKRKVRK